MPVAKSLEHGLTSSQAADLLAREGRNELPPPARRSWAGQLGAELVHFFALMLWVAAAMALAAGLPQLAVAIAVVVVLNALFAFLQERRADRAAERLRALLPRWVSVRRDGQRVEVEAAEVAPGDVLLLEAGDRVCADAEVADAHGLRADLSMLTGESEPLRVDAGQPLLAGSFVVEGEAVAFVTATGKHTRLAAIAQLTTAADRPERPLTRELRRVVRTIAVVAVAVGAAFFGLSILLGNAVSEGFVFAIGVTVALVPEALLPTVTLALAWGAEQMAHKRVLVRHLDAVETLGSTTFICTDKTGTLTRNQMTVVRAWTADGELTASEPGYDPAGTLTIPDPAALPSLLVLARAAARCSTGGVQHSADAGWRAFGDPMEAALDVLARRLGCDTEADRREPLRARFPFDARRRRMSVVTGGAVLTQGALDAVLPLCADSPQNQAAEQAATALAESG